MGNKASILCVDENGDKDFKVFETVAESQNSKDYKKLIPYFLWFKFILCYVIIHYIIFITGDDEERTSCSNHNNALPL